MNTVPPSYFNDIPSECYQTAMYMGHRCAGMSGFMGINSNPSNLYTAFLLASSYYFLDSNYSPAVIVYFGTCKLVVSKMSKVFLDDNLAMNFSSFINLILLGPSLDVFFHSNALISFPV